MNYELLVFAPIFLSLFIYLPTRKLGGTKYITLALFIYMFSKTIELYKQLPQDGYLELGNFLKVDAFDFVLTLQVDRLSVIMLLLTCVLLILVTLSSWSLEKKPAAYFSLLIFFSGAIFGVFMSTNLLWFFIFWELTLIPMFFLVGIWGAEGRIYAAVKFFLYTHVASMLILLAFFLMHKQSGFFDMTLIKESMLSTPILIWSLLFIGFAVKMPLFPFHTWLPDAHVQAPAPISALLAGVLLKMGAYGMIRLVLLLLPEASHKYAWILLVLGLLTLLFAGFMALYETHIKRMVAYSSISHMGLIAIAMAALSFDSLSAALYEMIGHALIISPLFLIAGFLHQKMHTWEMGEMGGIMQKVPYISAIFVLAGLGALGLPGTMGFIGEITILISSIKSFGTWMVVILIGSLISASYLIWTFRRVIYGEMSAKVRKTDFSMNKIEFFALLLFTLLIIFFGIFPAPLFEAINQAFSSYFMAGGAL
ncbi:MAG: NADH-quinone oxidoreductase subunit M [Sulfurimonas sp.]